jgi:hypothetical protein
MPKKQVECSGWHTKDEIQESLEAAKTLEDFRFWLLMLAAWPGSVVGFGDSEKKAGQDAKDRAKAAAADFCRVLRGCSEREEECKFDNYKATVQFSFEPDFEGGDWVVSLVVKQVKCKCAASDPPK